VIACLLDRASVHDVLDPAAAALSGKVLVNLTTSTPEDASELATWADKHDVAGFIDGGIMAVPSMIGGPDALILYSGSESGFSAHRDALEVFGTAKYVGTEPGRSALLDLAMLHGMYGMFVGFFQAAAIVDTEAVEVTEFTTSLLVPWLEAMLSALPKYAADIDAGDYSGSESNLAMQASGMGFAEFTESIGANGELLAPLDRLIRQRVADGHGGDDLSSVFELIRKPSRRRS
jgi:3-hydroxyisobutyrate dehydrogenase-like beta-hydroxyacid dehydrogenase